MTAVSAPDADAYDAENLPAAVFAPHDLALTALTQPDPGPLAAVAWCSAHLVAVHRVLYTAARRQLPDGRRCVRAQRVVDHRLQQALCRLDRRLTGDTHLSGVPVEELVDEVRARLHGHAEAEGDMVGELMTALGREQQEQLGTRLAKAMRCAPTRPHPHTRHMPLAGLVSRLDACVDRARDSLDSRVVPTPRRSRAAREPGRWGCYLMGTPYPTVKKPRG